MLKELKDKLFSKNKIVEWFQNGKLTEEETNRLLEEENTKVEDEFLNDPSGLN